MKVLIIIPAYNEAQNLKRVMEQLKRTCPQYDYIIVNDGSTDETREICKKNQYHVIHHSVNQGLKKTVQTGMQYAMEHHYDMALQFDADGQHLPEYIEDMVNYMKKTNCDIVIGSRFYKSSMPLRMRTLGGKMITWAIQMTTGKHLSDPTSGMRLYRRNILHLFVKNDHFAPEPDTIAYLIRMGADVREVKVKMEDRMAGQSYLTPVNATKYMIRMLSSILIGQRLWKHRKIVKDTGNLERVQTEINKTA